MLGKKRNIALFATNVSSRVQGSIYTELHSKAKQLGFTLVLFSGTYDKINNEPTTAVTRELFKFAESMDFAAYFIHGQSIGKPELIRYLVELGHQKKVPVFAYDCEAYGITRQDGVITILPDYKHGFRECINHLIEYHHCKNIFMLAGGRDNTFSKERVEVYREVMKVHNLEYCEEMIGYGDFWEIPATQEVNRFLDSNLPTPEAICCANDMMAIAAIKTLNSRGIRVPEDVLVTGFDGIEDGRFFYPSISTCEPRLEMVAQFIFDYILGNNTATEYQVPFSFYPKESCGCKDERVVSDRKEISRLVEISRNADWQHEMLTVMQFKLMNCSELAELKEHLYGLMFHFFSYSNLVCLKDNVEGIEDYTDGISKVKIFFNNDFLLEENQLPLSIKEVFSDEACRVAPGTAEDMYVVRLIHHGDSTYGFCVTKAERYESNDLKLLGKLVDNMTITIENILRNARLKQTTDELREMYDKMSEIYIRDALTGLYNRNGYYKWIEEKILIPDRKKGYLHIVSIDMNGMKQINDTLGHQEGDNALVYVARAITTYFSEPCVCVRFGGDEFLAAYLSENEMSETSEDISEKLNSYLAEMVKSEGKDYVVEVSVGNATADLSKNVDINMIERLADEKMYIDKRRRKSKD